MRKIVLLSLMSFGVLSSFAQQKQSSSIANESIQRMSATEMKTLKKNKISKYEDLAFAKTTATPFQTYTFAGGTATTLPTGWTTGTTTSGIPQTTSWKWRDVACTGTYNIGTINSTTASDGWLVYDSDSIGSLYPSVDPFDGWVQSPSIDCSTHGSVRLTFQQWFRTFRDSCFVDVSHDNGVSWDTFRIAVDNDMNDNTSLASNPTITRMNISSAAANQSNVIIRFRYVCGQNSAGGSFNWLIDDVELSELDAVETGISGGGTVMATGLDDTTSFGSIPVQFINDTLLPVVFIDNNGLNALSNVQVTSTVYNGSTQVTTETQTLSSTLASGATDVPVWFTPYNTTAVGTYTTAFSSMQSGDPIADNDVDTGSYVISDSVYHRYGGKVQGSYIIHSVVNSTTGQVERSFQIGTLFEIGPNTSDTLTAVYAAFSSSSDANTAVRAIVYKDNSGTWDRKKISSSLTLTSSDISTSSGVVYARIPVANYVMDEGNYVVVISGDNIDATKGVYLLAGEDAGSSGVNLLVGVADTSTNNPVQNSFSTGSIASSPLIRLVFGFTGDTTTSVNDIHTAQVGDAYPNPAKSEINIPFTMTESADVNVTITNAVGATIVTKDMGKYNANQKGNATFNVSNFANGIYFYTVEANGQRSTKRFVITH